MKNNFLKKIFGFSVVGVIITLFSIFLLFLFLKILNMNIYLGYVMAYFISISASYILNSFFVFKTDKRTFYQVFFYFLVYIISMLIGLIGLRVITYLFPNGDKFILSLLILPITFTWNFFFSNRLLTSIKNSEDESK